MARAKRTARAEARRRYRAALAVEEPEDSEEAATESVVARSPKAVASSGTTASRPAGSGRPSMMAALRGSYHPANVREDLTYLPSLLRNRAFFIPVALMVASLLLALVAPSAGASATTVAAFAFSIFLQPPAMGALFGAGFFAPRASYLLGAIIGLIDAILLAIFTLVSGPVTATTTDYAVQIGGLFLFGPITGIFFASLAAWYRRFLQLSSPRGSRALGGNTKRTGGRQNASRRR